MNSNVVVLVCSCDKFEDTWEICSKCLEEQWGDCPYERALLTESKPIPEHGFFDKVIHVNTKDWALMLHEALDQIEQDYVIFLLEDQWPVEKINQKAIELAISKMKSDLKIAIVYFEDSKIGGLKQAKAIDDIYNEIPFGAPYRLSCAPGIFRKDYLYEMTNKEISPWDFERVLSFDERGRNVRVLELKNSNWKRIDETGAIFRGKWVLGVGDYAKKLGISLDLEKRQEQGNIDVLKRRIKDCLFNINPRIILKIQNLIKNF
ncbi:hypothetical protein [Butyrivibrio sp. XBB1001]|uniref:hypothetical protein n=1 Tax=Butyrivibrio sp. XBB1001 TaxID=1280682 RepID=UPI0003F512D4|nr:hypothetical protein [Butyrivibrio sp. XBB1001]